MVRDDDLAARFEANRDHLRGVAYRMLGSLDDAVQRAWLRADQADLSGVGNLAGWLTTVTGRVCLDILRTRRAAANDRSRRPPSTRSQPPAAGRSPRRRRSWPSRSVSRSSSSWIALLELLAPDVVRQADRFAAPTGIASEVRGARAVANETKVFAARARTAEVALVNGAPGIAIAPLGRLFAVLRVTVDDRRITELDVIADPAQLDRSRWPFEDSE